MALVYSILAVKYEVKEEMRRCRKLVFGTYLVLALLSRVAEVSDIGVLRKRSQPHLWQRSSGYCRARRPHINLLNSHLRLPLRLAKCNYCSALIMFRQVSHLVVQKKKNALAMLKALAICCDRYTRAGRSVVALYTLFLS